MAPFPAPGPPLPVQFSCKQFLRRWYLLLHWPLFPLHFIIWPSRPRGLIFRPNPLPEDRVPRACPRPLPLPFPRKRTSSYSLSERSATKVEMPLPVRRLPVLPLPLVYFLKCRRTRRVGFLIHCLHLALWCSLAQNKSCD